jgi:hypothetical protein
MGTRGSQPGFKQARQEAAQAALVAPGEPEQTEQVEQPVLSASDRENPSKLSGDALRALAHRRGMARSLLPAMSDDKIREQLRYITYNQYESDAVA